MKKIVIFIPFLFLSFVSVPLTSHTPKNTSEVAWTGSPTLFIKKYAFAAQLEQYRYGVPACITLAQAMIESAIGTSYLARYANNYFGIKCGSTWNGEFVYHNDDTPHEKFRKYATAEQSFRDHSEFLRNRERYAFLFNLPVDDYVGWAKGLQRAGYATSRSYASALIQTIKRYQLLRYNLHPNEINKINNVFLYSYHSPAL